jgi:hypothetical protein
MKLAVRLKTVNNNNTVSKITVFLKKCVTYLFISVYSSIKFVMLCDLCSWEELLNKLISKI